MTLIDQLKQIPDPRKRKGRKHPLWFILFLSLVGSLCNHWGYRPLAPVVANITLSCVR